MVRILKHLLSKQGFEVATAADGAEGLAAVQSFKPQLLILDLDMPVKDGIAVLREMPQAGRPYVIVLSAHEGEARQSEARQLGAREVMVKPFTPADLAGKLAGLVRDGKV